LNVQVYGTELKQVHVKQIYLKSIKSITQKIQNMF